MAHPLRILEICPGFAIEGRSGGVGQYVLSLCRALNRYKIEPILCGLWHYGTLFENERLTTLRNEGFVALTAAPWQNQLGFLNVYTAFQGIWAFLRKNPVDIIHSHAEFSDFAALGLKYVTNTPVVMRTLHSHEWGRRPFLRFLARMFYPLTFDCEVGISPDVKAQLDQRFLARLGHRYAAQINNAIPLNRFQDAGAIDVKSIKANLGLPVNSLVVGYVGRLVKQKGLDLLLQAFTQVRQVIPQTRLVFIGSGEQESDFKKLADHLQISEYVIFAGMRNDVPVLLKCFDLFVLASQWEGLPTAMMEAMAAGVPVLGTNVSGTRDLVRPRETGWLVERTVSAITDGILDALRHPEEREALANRARDFIQSFDIKTMAKQYEDLYQTLAASVA
jgi:glycosyltransferase involved in cell wall biosynthesis